MRCRCLSASCAQLKSFLGQGFGYRRALYSLTELCKPNSIWFSCGSRVSTMAKVSTESRTECNGVLPLPLPQLAWCASLAGAMTLRTCSGNLEDRFAPGLREFWVQKSRVPAIRPLPLILDSRTCGFQDPTIWFTKVSGQSVQHEKLQGEGETAKKDKAGNPQIPEGLSLRTGREQRAPASR